MSRINSLPSERVAVAAVINPGAQTTGAKNSGWVNAALYYRFLAIIATGTLGTSATLDGKWQAADDAAGNNPVDIPNGAITQVVKASGDNKQVLHNLNVDEVPVGKQYVRYVATVGTATSDAAVLVLGFDPRSAPASDADASSVAQIKNT